MRFVTFQFTDNSHIVQWECPTDGTLHAWLVVNYAGGPTGFAQLVVNRDWADEVAGFPTPCSFEKFNLVSGPTWTDYGIPILKGQVFFALPSFSGVGGICQLFFEPLLAEMMNP